MMFKPLALLISAVLFATPQVGDKPQADAVLRDYSSQGETFRPLVGVLLGVDRLVFAQRTTLEAFGIALPATGYTVTATVNVQVSCNGFIGEFQDAVAEYTLTVASDPDGRVFVRFLESIHDYWTSKDSDYRENYEYLPARKHVFVHGNSYVLYSSPDNNLEGAAWLFAYRGRLIELRFDRFVSDQGWGALSSFVSHNLAFQFPEGTLRPAYKSDFPPDEFLAKYQQGFFVQCKD